MPVVLVVPTVVYGTGVQPGYTYQEGRRGHIQGMYTSLPYQEGSMRLMSLFLFFIGSWEAKGAPRLSTFSQETLRSSKASKDTRMVNDLWTFVRNDRFDISGYSMFYEKCDGFHAGFMTNLSTLIRLGGQGPGF